jgi:hypothetical protein
MESEVGNGTRIAHAIAAGLPSFTQMGRQRRKRGVCLLLAYDEKIGIETALLIFRHMIFAPSAIPWWACRAR